MNKIKMMRKTLYIIMCMLPALLLTVSCSDTETYGDMKEKERNAISNYIKTEKINVISEATFLNQGETTDVDKNEFVLLDKSGVYMQIVRRGTGEPIEENKQVNLLCRYLEYNILDGAMQTRNDYSGRNYDKMSVTRTGATFTASFSSGVMFSTYGASVPAGWLVPLLYINVGRQTNDEAEIAKVKLIVPHTQGHSYASSSVYPCYYIITYQRER